MLLEIRCVVAVSHDGLLVCHDFSTMKTVNLLCIRAFALPIQQKRKVCPHRALGTFRRTKLRGIVFHARHGLRRVAVRGDTPRSHREVLGQFYNVIYLFYLLKRNSDECIVYLKVTIICRYIFLRFWNSVHFTGIKFCVG